jgi:hypothetical protein
MDCVTPSHRDPIPHGETLDIYQLLVHPKSKLEPPPSHRPKIEWPYTTRKPVLARSRPNLEYLDAQIIKAERRALPKKSRSPIVGYSQRRVDNEILPSLGVLKSITLDTSFPSIPPVRRPLRPAQSVQKRGSYIKQVVD